MIIPPKYFLTPNISELLASIEASRQVIDSIQIPPEVEMNIKRQSVLKSSLFSARIEGNNLTLDDLQTKSFKSQKKIEVFNILKALNLILGGNAKDITLKQVLKIHEIVMDNLSENLGRFRQEVSAILIRLELLYIRRPRPAKSNLLWKN